MVQKRSRSLTYDEDNEHSLCLCEYYNKNNERVHLLMCCCNCEAVDSLCTSILCCQSDQSEQSRNDDSTFKPPRRNLLNDSLVDIADRLRFPMIGGARKFDLDFIISLTAIVIYLLIGTINFFFSLISIILLPCLIFARFFLVRLSSNRKEASSSSTVILASRSKMNSQAEEKPKIRIAFFMITNCLVISLVLFNLVLHEELSSVMSDWDKLFLNILLISSLLIHICLKYSNPGHVEPNQKLSLDDSNYCAKCNIKRDQSYWIGHCPVCRRCIMGRDHHCFYVDNCIGYLNHKLFLTYLLCFNLLFVYAFYSILKLLKHLDCNLVSRNTQFSSCLFDVYYSNFSRSFLTLMFIQLIPIILFVNMIFLQQLLFIGMGSTQHQFYKMSQKNVRFSLLIYLTSNFKFGLVIRNLIRFGHFRSKNDLACKNLGYSSHDHFV